MAPVKVYKKVVKFSFTKQKILWVLVFSIRIWYFAYPTADRSDVYFLFFSFLQKKKKVGTDHIIPELPIIPIH